MMALPDCVILPRENPILWAFSPRSGSVGKAGSHFSTAPSPAKWIPAFAGTADFLEQCPSGAKCAAVRRSYSTPNDPGKISIACAGPPACAGGDGCFDSSEKGSPHIREAVNPRGGAAEERELFFARSARGDALEGVPQRGIADCHLVDREVAFEHAALGAEQLDAGLDIGPPRRGDRFRRGRRGRGVE